MCYTSGTTGRPQGVVESYRAVVLHSLVLPLPDTFGTSSRDVILPVVPMFQVNAWGLPFVAAFRVRHWCCLDRGWPRSGCWIYSLTSV